MKIMYSSFAILPYQIILSRAASFREIELSVALRRTAVSIQFPGAIILKQATGEGEVSYLSGRI
jgi:hypothetical protein